MKRFFLAAILLLSGWRLFAQSDPLLYIVPSVSFDSAAKDRMNEIVNIIPEDSSEGGSHNAFSRWYNFWQQRISSDAPTSSNQLLPISKVLQDFMGNQSTYCNTDPDGYKGDWKCIGPFNNYFGTPTESQGRIDALWVNPNDNDEILAGANAGGLWKTTNGGNTWFNITDKSANNWSVIPGTMGVLGIAVNPLNHDIIYLSLGIPGTYEKSYGYGLGLVYTTDGGQTWQNDAVFNYPAGGRPVGKYIKKIGYMPGTEMLFVLMEDALMFKVGQNYAGWDNVTPADVTNGGYLLTDFEFSRQNPDYLVLSTNAMSNVSNLFNADFSTSPVSWNRTQFSIPNFTQQNTKQGITEFALTAADTAIIRFNADSNSKSRTILLKADINSTNLLWVNRNIPSSNPIPLAFENFDVSWSNPDIIYGLVHDAGNAIFRSTNGGQSFSNISSSRHADGRALLIYSTTNTSNGINDEVYVGTDGGVAAKFPGQGFTSITGDSLAITQFYGMSNTEADEDFVIGASQDNAGKAYIKDRPVPWNSVYGGDNFLTKFAKNGVTEALIEGNFPGLNIVTFAGQSSSSTFYAHPTEDCAPGVPYLLCKNYQRPLYFDEDNNAHIGQYHVWKKPLSSGTWDPVFINEPKDGTGLDFGAMKILNYKIAESNTDIAYIAYRHDGSGDLTDDNNFDGGQLFVTQNANANPVTWKNISPTALAYWYMGDIEIDQQNPNRIWVALAGVQWGKAQGAVDPDNMNNRVFYSDDYGDTWTDISAGLPPLPINKILYQDGSDDVLFAGTDAGVFKWNKYLEKWTCFNNGMPPCLVTDMEFNYCAGKLRVSTFGRGMWESPVVQNADVVGIRHTITSHTTWSSDKYLTGSVRVTSGNTLTISGSGTDIHMAKNSTITVEPGAQLIVTDATITNSCEDCMWLGIEAIGNANQSQSGSNQGKVTLTNARIEHARNATMNWPAYSGGGGAKTGGIIQAVNTEFINCRRSVAFNEYYNGVQKNVSFYRQCKFIIGDGYKGDSNSPFEEQVALFNVNGVKFYGCEFYNRLDNAQKGLGIGIHIVGGGGEVYDYNLMGNNPTHNVFKKFKFGVYAEAGSIPNYKTYIDGAIFDSCGVGIRGLNDHHIVTTNNNMSVGRGTFTDLSPTSCYKNIGIFLTACHNAIVEENTIAGVAPGHSQSGFERMGIVIDNSGGNDKQVYRNALSGMEYGVLAIGRNNNGQDRGAAPGLRITCNTFQNNARHIQASTDDGDIADGPPLYWGIATFQGSKITAAGNQFLSGGTPIHISNYARSIDYYYSGSNSFPSSLAKFNSAPFANYSWITPIAASYANSCPSRYGGGGYPNTTIGRGDIRSGYFTASAEKQAFENDLLGLVDGGHFEMLRDYINMFTIEDSTTVYDTLMDMSPWLSREILIHTADAGVLSAGKMKAVALANPEVIDYDLVQYLGSGSIPFPVQEDKLIELEDGMSVNTERGDLESEISLQGSEMQYFANAMLSHLLVDTLDTEADSIPVWYNRINTIQAEYDKISFYKGKGDFSGAEQAIVNMGTKFTLTPHEEDVRNLYEQFYNVLKVISNEGRSILEITDGERAELIAIHDDAVNINARQIIYDTKGITDAPNPDTRFICSYILVASGKQGNQENTKSKRKPAVRDRAPGDRIAAYPNPAKDKVTFTYNVGKPAGNLHIVVTNSMGKLVQDIQLNQKAGSIHLDTKQFAAGIYIYKLFDGNRTIDVGKVVVVK